MAPAFVRVLFALLEGQTKKLAIPDAARLPPVRAKQPKAGASKAAASSSSRAGGAAGGGAALTTEGAAELVGELELLVRPFCALVAATKQLGDAAGLVTATIKHAASFVRFVNCRVLPLLTAYFESLSKEVTEPRKPAEAVRAIATRATAV